MNNMQLLQNHICEKHFAFNIWDFESAQAVIDAAASIKQNVILQTSVGIYERLCKKVFVEFIKEYSCFRGIQAWLNLDHCKDKKILFSAVDSGWDMVMADGSTMNLKDNIIFCNEIISYAHKSGVLVEAEVGAVKGIEDDLSVQQESIAQPKEIKRFLSKVDADFIAVAFGNAHGEYKVAPKLHYDLVEYTTSITSKPFVVHGGSGLSDEVIKKLVSIKGVGKINISTDLKLAYKRGLERAYREWSQPINASEMIRDEIFNTTVSKMKLLDDGTSSRRLDNL